MSQIKGLCLTMCPKDELKWREKEHLLHKFEMLQGTEQERKPKADPKKIVKQFSRPAAGQKMIPAEKLRAAPVLLETVKYLMTQVVSKEVPWAVIYEFISDRLRAVCQDMTILRMSGKHPIIILECCVKFYLYSSYRLCEETTVMRFDPHINHTLLLECLKRLLIMYNKEKVLDDLLNNNNFLELTSIYLLYNLGSPEAMSYVLHLPPALRTQPPLEFAWKLSSSFWNGNLYKVLRLWNTSTPLLSCCLHRHLEAIRRNLLQVLNVAYSSKSCQFPVSILTQLLSTEDDQKTSDMCKYYGVKLIDKSKINFSKGNFEADKESLPRRKDSNLNNVFEKLSKTEICLAHPCIS